jgi:hypothetical protein
MIVGLQEANVPLYEYNTETRLKDILTVFAEKRKTGD